MRARRWVTTMALGGLAAGLLSGCVPRDGRTYPNATDVARAQRIWADPWLASDGKTVASPQGMGSTISRDVVGRGYQTQSAPRAIAVTEVRAAISTGWRLVAAQCDPDSPGDAGSASAQLMRGSSLDDWSLATLESSRRNPNISPDPTPGIPLEEEHTQVTIGASVPHHLDATWPDSPAIALETSCLVRGPGTLSSPGPSSTPPVEPTQDRLPGERVKPPTWSDGAEKDLRAAVDAISDDPGLNSLGLVVVLPASVEDAEPRKAAMASAKDVVANGGLAGSVSSLIAQGWTLTYAGCIGPGAPNVAELSRPTARRTAVLYLEQATSPAGDSSMTATVVVSTPGYSPETPTAITRPCFAESTLPKTFSHKGVPSLGPTRMFPRQS